jgi:D-serine deaminase-like pyridoxal phosphate-dependent protein
VPARTYECALVLRSAHAASPHYTRCAATTTYRNLRPGTYILYARAVTARGTTTAHATYRFKIS